MNKRKFGFVSIGAVAAVMAFVSIAYACTTIQGDAKVASPADGAGGTPGSVAPGGSISVDATGALSSHTYSLRFLNQKATQDTMLSCMGLLGDVDIGGTTVTSDTSGNITGKAGTIPAGAQRGIASVCFVDAGYWNATKDDLLVIT